ncbi:hypothetical protein BBK82_03220 [Lentzea guizhouensis]|uniref:Uncharacterized protein n=1 Tax=Lentzea guizhouensis TaxID=1586287 RepID=A0A1B2HBX3_9PSEU|nr:hypothetical protein [Lentzea guizhouensis]ANZ35228.1 hypothetical protein BBK82_03220 [Lentzea guizhouensis]
MSTETGRLLGGPHDGVEFPLDRFWLAPAPGAMPLPAERVLVDPDGHSNFWWRTRSGHLVTQPGPPCSRYDVDRDDPGWMFRYVGEVEMPIAPDDPQWLG